MRMIGDEAVAERRAHEGWRPSEDPVDASDWLDRIEEERER